MLKKYEYDEEDIYIYIYIYILTKVTNQEKPKPEGHNHHQMAASMLFQTTTIFLATSPFVRVYGNRWVFHLRVRNS